MANVSTCPTDLHLFQIQATSCIVFHALFLSQFKHACAIVHESAITCDDSIDDSATGASSTEKTRFFPKRTPRRNSPPWLDRTDLLQGREISTRRVRR